MNRLMKAIANDPSLTGRVLRAVARRWPGIDRSLTLMDRLALGATQRPYYAFCAIRAAELAVRLGHRQMSILEFGVAGGSGLLELEDLKVLIEAHLPIAIRLYGFDIGSGLPTPLDYRDLPYCWQGGFYEMDVARLKARLRSAELLLGPVSETVPRFRAAPPPDAPIGMISFDLDYYSSTVDAFKILDVERTAMLPRVFCYMDDIVGTRECYSDFTGERLAIAEFNAAHQTRKISRCYDFEEMRFERWQEKIMIYHDFEHPLYQTYVGDDANDTALPLRD